MVRGHILSQHHTEPWTALGRMLDGIHPQGLAILLPAISQLHRPAYLEARKRNVIVGSASISQLSAVTGLVKEAQIEAVVATEDAARAFVIDLTRAGLLDKIKGWFIVVPKGEVSTFVGPTGVTVYDQQL